MTALIVLVVVVVLIVAFVLWRRSRQADAGLDAERSMQLALDGLRESDRQAVRAFMAEGRIVPAAKRVRSRTGVGRVAAVHAVQRIAGEQAPAPAEATSPPSGPSTDALPSLADEDSAEVPPRPADA